MESEYTRVREHSILQHLEEKFPLGGGIGKCLSLLVCNGDSLFLWNSVKCRLEVADVKRLVKRGEDKVVTVIEPVPRPLHQVERLEVNPSGTLVCLWGTRGVTVIRCQLHQLGQAPCLHLGGNQLVRQVCWHPGSLLDCHLLVLTSDECLRLYDTLTNTIVWSSYLCQHYTHITLPTLATLGDTPVDFAFLAPSVRGDDYEDTSWPLLILWGNGDVYLVETKLKPTDERLKLQGPLRMYPTAEDNYGVDASSITVLQIAPPIVVLATCLGTLYHCLLLSCEEEPGKSLHVVESIELELGMSVHYGEDEDAPRGEEEDVVSCPIRLERDPVDKSRYICVHPAGVHAVSLPLVTRCLQLVNNPHLDFPAYGEESVVQYVVCTGVVVEGSRLVKSPLVGLTHLDLDLYLVVLSDGTTMNLNLPSYQGGTVLPGLLNDSEEMETGVQTRQFSCLVEEVMKECGKPPLLKLPEDSTNPKEWLEILLTLRQYYREKMFGSYLQAGKMIEERVKALRETVDYQTRMVERLNGERSELQVEAEKIAELYEEMNEKQAALMKRTEELLTKMRGHGGMTTKAEKEMEAQLKNARARMDHAQKEIGRLQSALKSQSGGGVTGEGSGMFLGENKKRAIRKNLQVFTQEVHQLTRRIKGLMSLMNSHQ